MRKNLSIHLSNDWNNILLSIQHKKHKKTLFLQILKDACYNLMYIFTEKKDRNFFFFTFLLVFSQKTQIHFFPDTLYNVL